MLDGDKAFPGLCLVGLSVLLPAPDVLEEYLFLAALYQGGIVPPAQLQS